MVLPSLQLYVIWAIGDEDGTDGEDWDEGDDIEGNGAFFPEPPTYHIPNPTRIINTKKTNTIFLFIFLKAFDKSHQRQSYFQYIPIKQKNQD